MFTGIVEKKGRVLKIEKQNQMVCVHIESDFTDLQLGESVAVQGVCLTVTKLNGKSAIFDIGFETLKKTNLKNLVEGCFLNLERALKVGDRFSGHYVQGHVDTVSEVLEVKKVGECYQIDFKVSKEIQSYCVQQGSITLNGVSLTLSDLRIDQASVMIIPHTWSVTQLSELKKGDLLNVEVDILSKYVEKLLKKG